MAYESQLESLLERTGQALLVGDLEGLEVLAAETQAALAEGLPSDPDQLLRLKEASRRTSTLLKAAIRGVKAAQRRAAEVAGHGRFATYDARGQKDVLGRNPDGAPRRF